MPFLMEDMSALSRDGTDRKDESFKDVRMRCDSLTEAHACAVRAARSKGRS